MSDFKNGDKLRVKTDKDWIVTFIGYDPADDNLYAVVEDDGDYLGLYVDSLERIPEKKTMWIGVHPDGSATAAYEFRCELSGCIAYEELKGFQIIEIEVEDV